MEVKPHDLIEIGTREFMGTTKKNRGKIIQSLVAK